MPLLTNEQVSLVGGEARDEDGGRGASKWKPISAKDPCPGMALAGEEVLECILKKKIKVLVREWQCVPSSETKKAGQDERMGFGGMKRNVMARMLMRMRRRMRAQFTGK